MDSKDTTTTVAVGGGDSAKHAQSQQPMPLVIPPHRSSSVLSFEDIPRVVIRSHSSSPPRRSVSSKADFMISQLMVSEQLKGSNTFHASVQLLLSPTPPVTEQTLCAALLFSRHKLSYFDKWLRDSVRQIVWRQPVLTQLEGFVIEQEAMTIFEDWLKDLNLTGADTEDVIWTVFMDCLIDRAMRREDMAVCMACIIFACAKLMDAEKSFAEIITASGIEDKVFLDVRMESSVNGNVLNWYNEYFLPKMRLRLLECRQCSRRVPFPSHHPDLTIPLTPFVSLKVSPFKHQLSSAGEPNQQEASRYVFAPWDQITQ